MSETVPVELKVLVERVVRPLSIPLDRQKRLRSEFLTHLQAIHAEEFVKDGDAAAALARTAKRFGDPAELAAELRRSVSWLERGKSRLEMALAQRPGESVGRFVTRMMGWSLLILAVLVGLVLVAQYAIVPQRMNLAKLRSAAGAVACVLVFLGGFLYFGLQLGLEWPRRRWSRMVLCLIGLIATWPASIGTMSFIAIGAWESNALPLPAAIAGGVFSTIVGTAVGILHRRDTTYRNEWATLDLQAM